MWAAQKEWGLRVNGGVTSSTQFMWDFFEKKGLGPKWKMHICKMVV